jgi:hypothetical protein
MRGLRIEDEGGNGFGMLGLGCGKEYFPVV